MSFFNGFLITNDNTPPFALVPTPSFHLLFDTFPFADLVTPSLLYDVSNFRMTQRTPSATGTYSVGGDNGLSYLKIDFIEATDCTLDFTIRFLYYRTVESIAGWHNTCDVGIGVYAKNDGSFQIGQTSSIVNMALAPLNSFFEISFENKAGVLYLYNSGTLVASEVYSGTLRYYFIFGGNSNAVPSPLMDNIRYYSGQALANGANSYTV